LSKGEVLNNSKSQELLLALKVKVPLLYLASLHIQEGPRIKGKLAAFIPGSLELVQMSAAFCCSPQLLMIYSRNYFQELLYFLFPGSKPWPQG